MSCLSPRLRFRSFCVCSCFIVFVLDSPTYFLTLKGSWLTKVDYNKTEPTCDLKLYTQRAAAIFYPQASFSSDPEPRTFKAISSSLLRQFPVTGVILSPKKDGCSHNNLHGSYQTHTTTTATGKKGNYSNHLIFSPAPPVEWGYLKLQQIRAKSDMNEMFQKIWPKQFQVVRLYNERKRSEKSYLKKIGWPVTAWAF